MPRLHLPIQDPCHENWDAMNREGDARRFCEVCTKAVHDLSALTERQARAVLTEESAKGRVCVRYRADPDGNIKFRQETVSAPALWRMTMAAAGLGLALLTGCTDSQPDEILEDRCVYEVGPWGFSAKRGQGTCPAVDEEIETPPPMVMGAVAIDPPPEPPTHEVKGDVGPEPVPVMGEAPMVEPDPVPKREVMGKIAPVELPEPAEIELMGDVAVEPGPTEEPCDPAKKDAGPRRL